jgi:6-phosphogluconolactonase
MDAEIVILPDARALAREAAGRFSSLARNAVAARGRFSAVLSGGSTPRILYRMLAEEPFRSQTPWDHVHLFWGDERCVPPHDAGSNFRMADEALLSRVPIPAENVFRIQGELDADSAAVAYSRTLEEFFCGLQSRFDLVLLGLGQDGHTASLFPGSPALDEMERLVVPATAYYQDRPAQRVTLTRPAINSARDVLFLVAGESKAEIVKAVLEGQADHLPARRIEPAAGLLTWLLDSAAASQLAAHHLPADQWPT